VKYEQNKYQEHLAAVQAMRRGVWRRLSAIRGYSLIVSDAAGAVPFNRDPSEPEDWATQMAIRVNLSEGTVTVENGLTLRVQHEMLKREGVPHTYTPCKQGPDAGVNEHAVIRLSINDAMDHLPGAFANASAEIRGYVRRRPGIRHR
jgi:hypothetical protein